MNEVKSKKMTPIQEFYAGQSIFITGGTGLVGKLLVEKLLRGCPSIAFIYMLVRPKKGKDGEQRIDQLLESTLFSKLKEERPHFRHQLVAISGDCLVPGLGLSSSNRAMLIREVSIVFHAAATIRFDDRLKRSVALNVRATRDIVELCKEMPRLKACIHVSSIAVTAHAYNQNEKIEEKFVDVPYDGQKVISFFEDLDDKIAENITEPLLGEWPNGYAITKALAEHIVRKESGDMPFGIFRLGLVVSTYLEPLRGWTDSMYGGVGVAAAIGTGLLRSLHCDGNAKADIIPGDLTINALIAGAWDVANIRKNSNEVPIYNYAPKENSLTWDQMMGYWPKYGADIPTIRAIWYYSFVNIKSKFLHTLSVYFLHYLPALLVDIVTVCIGKTPGMLKMSKKMIGYLDLLSYFTMREWHFTTDNVNALSDKLNEDDRKLFFMDMREINWDEYFKKFFYGMRIYLIKDPIETVPKARIRWQRLYWLHQATKIFLAYGLLRLVWFVVKSLYSIM